MVRKFFAFLNQDIRGLHQAAYILGSFAFLSQILGLVRDRVFAHMFGASNLLDVYFAAFRIPDFIFVAVASVVSLSVLIPFIAKYVEGDTKQLQKFLNSIFTVFALAISGIAVVVYFLIPELSRLLFPGIIEQAELVSLTRLLLLSPIILGISNLFGSVTQVYKRFFLYALGPILYNAGIVFGALFLYPTYGLLGLGWGVIGGALLHAIIQIPFLISEHMMPRPTARIDWREVGEVITLSLPRTIALSMHHVATIVLIGLASLVGEGAITIFNFSWNLQSAPLAIIGVSYSVAAFPTLARLFSGGKQEEFLRHITVAARHIIFWSLPMVVLFIVLRAQIVRVIYGSGEFGWTDTRLTAASLAMFMSSLVAQALVLLFVRGYYAAGNTRRPLVINVVSSLAIIGFAYGFMYVFEASVFFRYFVESLFRISDLEGTKVLALPFAYSLGLLLNAFVFWILFQRDFKRFSSILGRTFFQSLSASVVAGFAAHRFLNVFSEVFDLQTAHGIFLQGFCAGVIGIFVGIIILVLLENEEVRTVWRTVHTKFWRSKPISPDTEGL